MKDIKSLYDTKTLNQEISGQLSEVTLNKVRKQLLKFENYLELFYFKKEVR